MPATRQQRNFSNRQAAAWHAGEPQTASAERCKLGTFPLVCSHGQQKMAHGVSSAMRGLGVWRIGYSLPAAWPLAVICMYSDTGAAPVKLQLIRHTPYLHRCTDRIDSRAEAWLHVKSLNSDNLCMSDLRATEMVLPRLWLTLVAWELRGLTPQTP